MSKRHTDRDYDPSLEMASPTKKAKVTPKTTQQAQTFLTSHSDDLVRMHKAGMKPTPIANTLCQNTGLREGAVTGKQVSNWLYYHKKSKKLKTRSVSGKNKNLRAEDEDQGWQVDLAKTAEKDGLALEEEDLEELTDDEEEGLEQEMIVAGKYFRFFQQHNEKIFVLFVELGIHREIEVRAINDYAEVELFVKIPLPPDQLFHFAGFPNATQVDLEATKTNFRHSPS